MNLFDPNYGLDPLQQSMQQFAGQQQPQMPTMQPPTPSPQQAMNPGRKDPTALMMLASSLLAGSGPQRGNPGFGARLGGAVGQVMPQILNLQSIKERTEIAKQDRENQKHQFEMQQAARDEASARAKDMIGMLEKKLGADGTLSDDDNQTIAAAKYAMVAGDHSGLLKLLNPQKDDNKLLGAADLDKFTPESLAAYAKTKDPSQLVPIANERGRVLQMRDGTVMRIDDKGNMTEVRSPTDVVGAQGEIKSGKAAIDFRLGYPAAVSGLQDTINKIVTVKKDMAGLSTGPGGEVAEAFSPKLQEMAARLGEFTLDKIAEFKQKGVSLSPMTERDFEFLKGLSGGITKYPAANMALLDRAQQAAQRIQDDLNYQMQYLESGGDLLKYKGRPRPKLQEQQGAAPQGPTRAINPQTNEVLILKDGQWQPE